MSEVPEHCPGTQSEEAGKASACAGCPNQQICASAPKGPDPAIPEINERMRTVKRKILVLSGKGGVGKSTVSCQLAYALAARDLQVGLLDVDICGPSVPKMMGVESEEIHTSNAGWTPVYREDNLAVMSIGFLLPNPDDAVIWRGPKKNGMIKNFVKDVDWGELDYLIVDTPPGTSDEHLSVVTYLKECGIDGAVVVTTPQDVSVIDVRKEISFCKKVGIPIIGVIENMSGFICPCCQKETAIFRATSGGGEALAASTGTRFLGKIPLDPNLVRCAERGESFLAAAPESPGSVAFQKIVQGIVEVCPAESAQTEGAE